MSIDLTVMAMESKGKLRRNDKKQTGCAAAHPVLRKELRFFALENLVDDSRSSRARERTYDEHPKSAQRLRVAVHRGDQSGTEASCGVHRGACKSDAEDMNKCKGKTDDKSSERSMTSLLGSYAQYSKYKNECKYYFNDQTRKGITVNSRKTVGTIAACHIGNPAE